MSPIKRVGTVFLVFALSIALILLVVITAVYAAEQPQTYVVDLAASGEGSSLLPSSALSVTIMSSPFGRRISC